MNNILQKVISIVLISTLALSFASCSKTDESRAAISIEQEGQNDDPDVTTITFAIEECYVDENNLKIFNEELLKDGYKYQLRVKYISGDVASDYRRNIETELKNGTSDVVFLGYDDGSNSLIDLINSGLLLNLDDLISSDKGKALYEAFPKVWWEAVKVNGHTYSIPNPPPVTLGAFAAFNRDYISEDAIEKWDGSIEGIYDMIKKIKWNDEESPRFKYCISDYSFTDMIGCEIQNGLLYDHDTMKIENPFESEKYLNYLKVLEQMKNDGFMKKTVSYYANTTYIDEEEDLKSGKFLVVLSEGEPEEYLLKDNICIKRIPPCFSSQIAASIGISKKTENLDAVIDFLGLLYGEDKYANLLLYGKQDVDYKLKDGYVADMDGTEQRMYHYYFTKTALNLFINTHPVVGEDFVINRKESYFAYYASIKLSPFIGFQPDSDNKGVISQDMDDFMDSLSGKPLDESIKKYSAKLKADGMDEYLNSVRKQWEEYSK